MSYLTKLYELAAALDESASNEGCEADLMVVGSAQLWDLLQFVRLLKAANERQESPGQADAADLIRLTSDLKTTSVALSQAMQHSEKAGKFVERIAGLSIWGYDKDDGTPYKECEEPSDGYLDSHCCLMDAIKEARGILGY